MAKIVEIDNTLQIIEKDNNLINFNLSFPFFSRNTVIPIAKNKEIIRKNRIARIIRQDSLGS